jgi:hypothetical protein
MSEKGPGGPIHYLNGKRLRGVNRIITTSTWNWYVNYDKWQTDMEKPACFSTTGKTHLKEKKTTSAVDWFGVEVLR